jgi:hypothetical protein
MPPKKLSSLKEFAKEIIGEPAMELMKQPKKLKSADTPKFIIPTNAILQCDTLYFPETTSKFKFCLVACDVATNKCDAEPMKDRSSNTILQAFKVMLKRKYIKLPFLLMVDGGSEFKSEFSEFMKNNHVAIQICKYHRQLLPVDHICNILGKYLGGAMLGKEINTDKTNKTEWKRHLGKLIKVLNDNYTKTPIDPDKIDPDIRDSGNLFDIGTKVKILLSQPINYVDGSKLHGKFRAGDIRWSRENYFIQAVHLNPNQPVIYTVQDSNGNILKNVGFVKDHLKIVS